MSDPDTLLTLITHDALEASLSDLREMESVLIDIDAEKEALVPRPDPPEDIAAEARSILDDAETGILRQYEGSVPDSGALGRMLKNAAKETAGVDESAIDAAFAATEVDGETPETISASGGDSDSEPGGASPSAVEAGLDGGDSEPAEKRSDGDAVAQLFDDEVEEIVDEGGDED